MRKNVCAIIIAFALLSVGLCIADYFNYPSLLGIDIPSINWDFTSMLISNIIVIILYLITFVLIDHSNIKRSENQERNVRIILNKSYTHCKEFIELLDNKENAKMAAKKCNFDVPNFQDPVMVKYQDLPFELEQYILDASHNGILSEEEFQTYINIRKLYKSYITNRITFFDADKYYDNPQITHSIIPYLEKTRSELISEIERQLKK